MKISIELGKVFASSTALFYVLMVTSVLFPTAFKLIRGNYKSNSLAIETFKNLSLAENKIRLVLSGSLLYSCMFISYEYETNRLLAALLAVVTGFVFYYNYKTLRTNYLKHTIYPILIFTLCIVVFVASFSEAFGIIP